MEIQTSGSDDVTRIVVQGEMTIYEATEAKAALLAAVRHGHDVEIDLTAVTEMDSAGFQCLLIAQKAARLHGRRLSCTHSAATGDVVAIFGMQAELGTEKAAA